MGLGLVGPQFRRVLEEEVNVEAMEVEVDNHVPEPEMEIMEAQEGVLEVQPQAIFVGMENW